MRCRARPVRRRVRDLRRPPLTPLPASPQLHARRPPRRGARLRTSTQRGRRSQADQAQAVARHDQRHGQRATGTGLEATTASEDSSARPLRHPGLSPHRGIHPPNMPATDRQRATDGRTAVADMAASAAMRPTRRPERRDCGTRWPHSHPAPRLWAPRLRPWPQRDGLSAATSPVAASADRPPPLSRAPRPPSWRRAPRLSARPPPVKGGVPSDGSHADSRPAIKRNRFTLVLCVRLAKTSI